MSIEQIVDESLTLKEEEWQKILSSDSLEQVKSIITKAKEYRDKVRGSKVLRKQARKDRTKRIVKAKLGGKAKKFRADLVKNQTPSETKMKAILKFMGIKYEFQKIFYTETTFYIVDFYLPDRNIVIELDGGYHNTKEQKAKDKKRSKALMGEIDGVYRLKNEAVENVEITKKLVEGFLAEDEKRKLENRMERVLVKKSPNFQK
jgi:very-short-patch-repair endonuclease